MIESEEVNYEEFLKSVESNEEKEAQSNANNKGWENPDCIAIGNKAIVRFVNGIPETSLDQGKKGSGRAKLFNTQWIKDDEGKPFKLTIPAIIKNKPMYPSIIFDFIEKVLSRTWIDNPNPGPGKAKGEWRYFYSERDDYGVQTSGDKKLKDIFWNVFKSGADQSNPYYASQKSWKGQTIYIANVIDRLDYKWHQDNKKTKLLMKAVTLKDNQMRRKEVSYYSIGTPLEELSKNHGFGLNYDVLIIPGKQPLDKLTLKNVSKLKQVGYWDDVNGYITDADKKLISEAVDFTDEEKTWEPIDIDKFYRFTSAATILKRLGKTIHAFDMMVGTNFTEKLKEEADAEAKARKDSKIDPSFETSEPVVEETPVTSPATNTFDNISKVEDVTPTEDTKEPEPMTVSEEAKNSIEDFYATLE